jgi:hypothetical protein
MDLSGPGIGPLLGLHVPRAMQTSRKRTHLHTYISRSSILDFSLAAHVFLDFYCQLQTERRYQVIFTISSL